MTLTAEEEAAIVAAIEAKVERLTDGLQNWALHMAGKLNAKVFLIGSVLYGPYGRDVDVRMIIDDHEFGARYGMEMKPCDEPPTATRLGRTAKIMWDDDLPTQRWVDECAKLGHAMSVRFRENFDIKVWPSSYWREDTYPPPILLAAPSQPKFFTTKYVKANDTPPSEEGQ